MMHGVIKTDLIRLIHLIRQRCEWHESLIQIVIVNSTRYVLTEVVFIGEMLRCGGGFWSYFTWITVTLFHKYLVILLSSDDFAKALTQQRFGY